MVMARRKMIARLLDGTEVERERKLGREVPVEVISKNLLTGFLSVWQIRLLFANILAIGRN